MPGRVIISTERLSLREVQLDDLEFVASMLGDPEVVRFWPAAFSRDDARGWIAKQRSRYETDGFGYWLAIEHATGEPVGAVGLMTTELPGGECEVGLGWIVNRPHWRRGFAYEGASACVTYAFDELGLGRLTAVIRPENEASLGVARKLGMIEERETEFAGLAHILLAHPAGTTRTASSPKK
ncbi:MAG: GNAT family N-acetyltransferase [Phycisphaerales bacterium]